MEKIFIFFKRIIIIMFFKRKWNTTTTTNDDHERRPRPDDDDEPRRRRLQHFRRRSAPPLRGLRPRVSFATRTTLEPCEGSRVRVTSKCHPAIESWSCFVVVVVVFVVVPGDQIFFFIRAFFISLKISMFNWFFIIFAKI